MERDGQEDCTSGSLKALRTDKQNYQGLDLPSLLHPTTAATTASSTTSNPARLIYIDAFSHLSFPASVPTPPLPSQSHKGIHTLPPFTTLSTLEAQILALLPAGGGGSDERGKYLVAIDGLDLLLAIHSSSSLLNTKSAITPVNLASVILTLCTRPAVHSTIVTCSADAPLLHLQQPSHGGGGDGTAAAAVTTPLERCHRAFVTSLAYQAERVVQLRGLDTGAARDVSGVLRVSRGGAARQWKGGRAAVVEGNEGKGKEERGEEDEDKREEAQGLGEWLYQVKSDGSVRIWARGE